MENQELNYEQRKSNLSPIMSVKDWVITILLTMIPLVGLIMLCIWAFGGNESNENKKNWAKALLIIQIASMIIVGLIYAGIIITVFSVYKTR